jgi:hypothetical protein
MNVFYAKSIAVPDGWELVPRSGRIEQGDTFMASIEDEPVECVDTVGMWIEETPFVAVFRRKEAPCSTS